MISNRSPPPQQENGMAESVQKSGTATMENGGASDVVVENRAQAATIVKPKPKRSGLLRLATYMVPHLPLGLYQCYQEYLTEALNMNVELEEKSQWGEGEADPFTQNQVDIGFMHTLPFLRLLPQISNMELLEVGPIHPHAKGSNRAVHYSDVIIHSSFKFTQNEEEKTMRYTIESFKGMRLGLSSNDSVSSKLITTREIHRLGFDFNHFSQVVITGCDVASIEQILNKNVNVAVVDSTCLACYLSEHPEANEHIRVIHTWGPLPVQPIVVRSNLPAALKDRIKKALLSLSESKEWSDHFARYTLTGFQANTLEAYDEIHEATSTEEFKLHNVEEPKVYY